MPSSDTAIEPDLLENGDSSTEATHDVIQLGKVGMEQANLPSRAFRSLLNIVGHDSRIDERKGRSCACKQQNILPR
jgi:hypothetical protein